ncbi:alpha/beta hydrolase family protein [Halomarina rubra]|uniref:Alpha/beta hydrolase family protein n=1 Tax=Halomarina rubra TaxID=2071873 RepID=A0ABD6AVY5_9EURY|nr:acetylxylan esterase [Halomarina rubra]
MDGFLPALDGHYDAADQLTRYLRRRAEAQFERTHAEKRAVDTREEYEDRRERVREWFLDRIGGLPDRPEALAMETVGTDDRDGYRVERIVFESHPRFHVTANCYVPESEVPHPGVLFLCGHVDAGKADPLNQRACIELATNGVLVLVVDSLGQGEREQYPDTDLGADVVRGGVSEHCYAGQQCLTAGATLARYVVHDDRCALDVLATRDDVDSERLGVVGTSGGGLRTQFLGLLDDRVAVAAPCCSVTTRAEWLRTGKRIDAEQLLPGAIADGVDHDDFLAAMAPRPLLVGAAASDQYFPVEGVHDAVERARRVYDLSDVADRLELVVADEPHCSVYDLGDPVYEWLCAHLGVGEYSPRDEHAVVDPSALDCTTDGAVLTAFPDERTVTDLLRSDLDADRLRAASAGDPREDEAASDVRLRDRLVERFDLDRSAADRHPRTTRQTETDGFSVEHVWFRTERDPDVVVAGVLVSTLGVPARSPAVVCYEDGTEAVADPDRAAELRELAAERGTAFAFDPRGVGAVRNREIPIPHWVDAYDGVYGTEFELAYDALDDSLFGMRVFDVLCAAAFLRSRTDSQTVSLVGEGVGAYHALYAAGADERVDALGLRDLGPNFREMATSRDYPYDARLTVSDVLDCDVPDVFAALDERGVAVERGG